MPDTIRILIADRYAILREGLVKLLEEEPDFAVVGEACTGHETVDLTQRLRPDVLLLDPVMPGVQSLDVLRTIGATALPTRIVIWVADGNGTETIEALQLGARGVVAKDVSTQLLMKAIRTVMTGQYWIGREGVSNLVESLRTQMFEKDERPFGLTARELEIVVAVSSGYANKEVAKRFSLSEETVKHHLTKIYSKVGVANRLELALFAISHRLLDRP